MGGDPRFLALLDAARETHIRKNTDYAGEQASFANFRAAEAVGIPAFLGAFVRLQDKESRVLGLMAGGKAKVTDEALADTMLDQLNYTGIVEVLRREWVERPYKEKLDMARRFLAAIGVEPAALLALETVLRDLETMALRDRAEEGDLAKAEALRLNPQADVAMRGVGTLDRAEVAEGYRAIRAREYQGRPSEVVDPGD